MKMCDNGFICFEYIRMSINLLQQCKITGITRMRNNRLEGN